jgi:uncharacterized SAM-binding protein YcdF (DUF218 family)
MTVFVLLFLAGFVFFGCFLWDSFVDKKLHKMPSDWLGYGFLTAVVLLLGYGSKYLDSIILHPYRSGGVVLFFAVVLVWAALFLWRKAEKWDKKSSRKHRY